MVRLADRKSRVGSSVVILLCILGCTLLTLGVPASLLAAIEDVKSDEGAQAIEAQDPVVRDVVRMLRAGVAEQVVLEWLESAQRPGALSANDLIALAQADAPETVQRRLLQLASEEAPPAPEAVPTPPAAPTPPATNPPQAGEGVLVTFRLGYRPLFDEDEEPWDLYVYINGDVLTFNSAAGLALVNQTQTFDVRLVPGKHVLRLLQERHTPRRSDVFHEARVCMEELILEVEEDTPLDVQLDFTQPRILALDSAARIDLQVVRAGEVLVNREIPIALPDDWRPLCEEIEANWPERIPRALRNKYERCVRWPQLWQTQTVAEQVPDRATVRERLAAFNYRPVPATSR